MNPGSLTQRDGCATLRRIDTKETPLPFLCVVLPKWRFPQFGSWSCKPLADLWHPPWPQEQGAWVGGPRRQHGCLKGPSTPWWWALHRDHNKQLQCPCCHYGCSLPAAPDCFTVGSTGIIPLCLLAGVLTPWKLFRLSIFVWPFLWLNKYRKKLSWTTVTGLFHK